MSYNTKNLVRDLGSLPVPQYYNPTADAYEVTQGVNGANRTLIYDISGNPLFTSGNPGYMQLSGSNPTDAAATAVPWQVFNGSSYDRVRTARSQGDAWSGIGNPGFVPYLTNGNSYDRQYNNTQGTLLASAARTATATTTTQTNYNARGVQIVLNVTAVGASGGIYPLIQGFDPVSSATGTFNASPTPITAIGTYIYELYPLGTTTTSGNVQQRTSGTLPRSWRVAVIHADSTSYTYSVGYSLNL